MLNKLISTSLKRQKCSVICVPFNRYYCQEMKTINTIDTAHLKRGSGGRSSFSGNVVTVFGATGFLGRHICNELGKRGNQLIIPYRCDPDDEFLKYLKLKADLGQMVFIPFHLKDPSSIRQAIKYSNIVINLIGRDFETRNFSFYDVHVEGAREIAKACREFNVKRLIHFSSLNLTEKPEKYYIRKIDFLPSKLKGEQAVLEEYPSATIFRPAAVFGSFDRFIWPLATRKRYTYYSIPLYAKGEKTIRQPVYVGDVAKAVVNAINDYGTRGKIYQAVGPEKFYLKDIAVYCGQILQRHVRKTGFLVHDIKYDPFFLAKVFVVRHIIEFFHSTPVRALAFEYIERESVSDVVDPTLPTLLDLGVPLTTLESKVPGLIGRIFLDTLSLNRIREDFLPVDNLSPKALNDYGFYK